jgi:HSP20 family molecular chaperone IbpA
MFNKKKKCPKCNSKISKDFDFCPYCGNRFNSLGNEDWGMLGKNDFLDMNDSFSDLKLPMGFNTIFNALIKNLDKEFQKIDKELGKPTNNQNVKNNLKSGGISISISSTPGKNPKIDVKSFGNMPEFKNQEKKIKKTFKKQELSEDKLKKISNLPREEPSTNVKRLSDRMIYEINIPGVKSIKDISIIQLENSIEIKAIGKGKAYFKLIPLSYPIISEKLSKGKLILELDNRE